MRAINELIWHCTATPAGREVTVEEITAWHKARGFKTIGYHKVVHLDGSVSDGRPESQVGAHVENHNTGTLGYVYVGGVDANDPKKARDTRTPAQKRTMERLTREAIKRYPIKKVSGHRQYANKACPCFDAQKEYAPLLNASVGAGSKDPADLRKSRTLMGSGIATGGVLGQVAAETAAQIEPLADYSTVLKVAFVVLTLAGLAFVAYARLDDAGWFKRKD